MRTAALVLALCASVAHAEPGADPLATLDQGQKAALLEALRAGSKAFDAGHFGEALQAFDRDPKAYAGVVLTGAPISYPDAFTLIRERCRAYYEKIGNEQALKQLESLEKLDPKAP